MTLSENTFFYISDGEPYLFDSGRETALPSGVLTRYIEGVRDRAKRNEWKESGSGAIFMGTATSETPESAVSSINARTLCIGFDNDRLLYSLKIDNVCGIYSKRSFRDMDEGMVLSDRSQRYGEFDTNALGDLCVAVSFAGETHIGIKRQGQSDCVQITEGESVERDPVWSKVNKDLIYYSSAGLERREDKDDEIGTDIQAGMFSIYDMIKDAAPRAHSPFSLCSIDIKKGEIAEIRSSDKFDFIKPRTANDGSLYYIKKPFENERRKTSVGGCLLDILTAPIKLIGALVGFFNIFTIKYSGKNLRSSGDTKTKHRSDDQIFIDGNIISAERELKANADRGEKYPGFIPRSFELHKISRGGEDVIVKKGVIAYTLRGDDVIYSNGSSVILLSQSGSETLLSKAEKVTFLL